VVMTDFGHAQVLDRLLVYERRLESSLYRTMAQLRREREARAAAVQEEVSRSEGNLAAGQESTAPAKLASFGADAVAGSQTRQTALGSSEPLTGVACGTGMEALNARLYVGDPVLPVAGNHGRDARATETPYGVTTNAPAEEPSCETKPILTDAREGQTAWGREVRSDSYREEPARTG